MQRIQNVKEGKRHQKKETSGCFCFFSFCFWGEVSNNKVSMILAETSCWEIERKYPNV
jgi:hypothetical protein